METRAVVDWSEYGADMSEDCSVDVAVRLVRQAVNQDSKRNYPEAARCYREAILILQDLKSSRRGSASSCKQPLLDNFLNTKLVQYEERLRIIEQHLLSKSDLSKFFKDLESCHFDDCRSSVSSDTKHLYKNPLLVKALDLIRRGRKEDDRRNYRAALVFYESGLAGLWDVLNKGLLTERQEENARVKCLLYHDRVETLRAVLETGAIHGGAVTSGVIGHCESRDSLDSECDSPVPTTDTDTALNMSEVRSCSSRLGSTHSLSDKRKEPMNSSLTQPLTSSMSSLAKEEMMAQSLHSLYPVCEIRHSPSSVSLSSNHVTTTVPLANINKEFCLSEKSLASTTPSSSVSNLSARRLSRSIMSNMEKISVLEISADDTFDQELVELKDHCDDKSEEGSDSGYSDPSPDGTIRDSKSPSGSLDIVDRKSPFSDLSEHDLSERSTGEVIPRVIIVNEEVQTKEPSVLPRQLGRQQSRFQNPATEKLLSQISQDKVLVLDDVDGTVKVEPPRLRSPKKEVTIRAVPDVYGPRVRDRKRNEYIPPRAVAREAPGEHGDMNKGCYYLMSALDFCWCL